MQLKPYPSERGSNETRSAKQKALLKMKTVTKPVVELKTKTGNTISLYVYDARERCTVGEHRMFEFGGDKTAGLVYKVEGEQAGGTQATDYNINNPSTWAWVQKWMKRGMVAGGVMDESELTDEEKR